MICLTLNGRTLKENRQLLTSESAHIGMAEIRADLLDPEEWPGLTTFARETSIPLILTCRRPDEGGNYRGEESLRFDLLRQHAPAFHYLDIEHNVHQPQLGVLVRAHGRRILRSFHSFVPFPSKAALVRLLSSLRHQSDEITKIAVMSHSLDDTCKVLAAALESKGPQVVLAMSDWGEASRVLYRAFGSLWSYACPDSGEVAPGQVSARELDLVYRAPQLSSATAVFAIVGDPVSHSGSPAIHNPLFADKGLDAVYLKIRCQQLDELWHAASLLQLRGFSVTSPHKEGIRRFLSEQSAEVEEVGACNTVVCHGQHWRGDNTDTDGILLPLGRQLGELKDKQICVIGSGGAARAAIVALQGTGAAVTLAARNPVKAERLAQDLGCPACPLEEGRGIPSRCHAIIQASSAGLDNQQDPIPHYRFSGHEVAFEMIYHPPVTRFLERAGKAGCRTIDGREMLQAQAWRQQQLFAQACRG